MATNVAKIQAELDLDAGKFHGSITMANGVLKKFNSSVKNSDASLKNIERRVTGLGASLRDTMVVMGQFRAALYTVWMFTGQWAGAIVEANAKLERLQMLMQGLSRSTTQVGRFTEGLQNMNYVFDKARNAPFTVDALADSFVKLKASGIDPTAGAMDALIQGVARFGGTSETLHRASIAIQQMAGKGVISMEELRQQLGEAIPNAMMLMAQATGMSMAKLVKLVSTGRLEAKTALAKLALEMKIQFSGSAENMMTTWTGMMQKLKTEWLLFAQEIGKGEFFNTVKDALQRLMNFMNSDAGKEVAREIGRVLAEATKAAVNLAEWLINNREELVRWGKLLAQVFLVKKITDFSFALVSMGANVLQLTRNFGSFGKAVAAARAGTVGWSAVIGAAAGPIGIAVAAIGGLIFWLNQQADAARNAADSMRHYYEQTSKGKMVSDAEQAAAEKRLDYLNRVKKAIDEVKNADTRNQYTQKILHSRLNALREEGVALGFNLDDLDLTDFARTTKQKAEELGKVFKDNYAKAFDNVQAQLLMRQRQRAKEYTDEFIKIQSEKDEAIMKATTGPLNDIQEKLNAGTIKEGDALKQRTDILLTAIDKRLARIKAASAVLRTIRDTSLKDDAVNAASEQLAGLDQLMQQALRDRETVTSELKLMPKMGFGGEEAGDKKSDLTKYLEQVVGKVAELQARLDDANPTLERFKAQLTMGKYGANPNDNEVQRVIAALEKMDQLQKDLKIKDIIEDIRELEAQSGSDLMIENLENVNGMYEQVSVNMVSFKRKLEVMRLDWIKAGRPVEEFNKHIAKTKDNMLALDFSSLQKFASDSAWNAYLDSLPQRARDQAEFNKQLQDAMRMIDTMAADDPKRAVQIRAMGSVLVGSIQQQYVNATKPAWASLLDQWNDTTTQMDQMWANSMQSFTDTLVEAVTTGKANFRDLATSILKEISRILMSKAVAQLAQMIMNLFGSSYNYNPSQYSDSGGLSGMGNFDLPSRSAKGNIFAWGNMRRFANGGMFTNKITNGTNIAPMAMFGEAGPEAIMPLTRDGSGKLGVELMGGAGGIVNQVSISVQVNQDGSSKSDVNGTSDTARQLGQLVDARVRDTMAQEMKPGGLLWRMQH